MKEFHGVISLILFIVTAKSASLAINLNGTLIDEWTYNDGRCCNNLDPIGFSDCGTCNTFYRISVNSAESRFTQNPLPQNKDTFINNSIQVTFSNSELFKFCMNITYELYVNGQNGTELIERWLFNCVNLRDKGSLTYSNLLGEFTRAEIANTRIRMNCQGSGSGFNCENECEPPNNITFCDDFGKVKCFDRTKMPPQCSKRADPCQDVICRNGGECTPYGDVFYCKCREGYGGLLCGEELCNEENCINGACNSELQCVCDPGYKGSQCELESCEGINYCGDNGICLINEKNNSRVCICINDTLGPTCQYSCQNGCVHGSCELKSNGKSASCVCDEGFQGKSCDARVLTDDDDRAGVNIVNILTPLAILVAAGLIFLLAIFLRKAKSY